MAYERKKEKKDAMAKCHIELLNNHDHSDNYNKNEDKLCDLYLKHHYERFSKKRFPFLYDKCEIKEDIRIDVAKMKLPNHLKNIIADSLAIKMGCKGTS